MSVSFRPVFLCSAKRTAIAAFNGGFTEVAAPKLAAQVIEEVCKTVPKESIEQVILGCVLSAGLGQAPARQAALFAGLSPSIQALTVNKVCSSGLKAVMLAADAVMLGHADAILAGGMENMTRAPFLLPTLRSGARLGHTTAQDSVITDGLWDVYNNFHMGSAGELCAREFGLTREMQDTYATLSYQRARAAIEAGYFTEEIVPVTVPRGREQVQIASDEEPAKANLDKFSALRPAFAEDGTITAANASSLNDGAAIVLVCSEEYCKRHSLTPLARVVAQGWNAQAPEWFTTAPIGAMEQALQRAGLGIEDIDLFEINEAFSAVALACQQGLGIASDRLNISGGAVALGHPIGASGARILTTLLYNLRRLGKRRGAVAICNGGGEATSLIVETV